MIAGSTTIERCSCKSEYQDAMYGEGMRVHSACKEKDGRQETSCTGCQPPRSMARLIAHGLQHDKAKHG